VFIPERRFVRRFVREERKITQEFLRGISITPREKFLLKLLSNKNPKTNILTTDQIEILVYSKNICKKCWTMGYHKLQCSCGSIDFWKNNPSSW